MNSTVPTQPETHSSPHLLTPLQNLGARLLNFTQMLGAASILLAQVAREIRRKPLHVGLIVEQIYIIGIRSIGITAVTAFSTGMVMSLQFGLGLEKFGGKLYVPKLTSLAIMREIAPVFCSLMLAARVGAGIASELGSMNVTQQIDAIRALGTSPIKRIVIPRLLACLISVPILCAFGNLLGIIGALLVGVLELGLDPMFFVQKVLTTCTITDYLTGLGKTLFFALIIATTACYFGMNVRGGTQGVGSATTRAVVVSSVLILIGDFFLTKAFFMLFEAK
jgi:phospholipid/cholesterol/gamma-HCH transport system permease protein